MNQIISHILQLKQKHHVTKVYVDGANPEVIRELKRRTGEYQNYHYYTEEQLWNMRNGDMQIIPVNFQKRHRGMLQWTFELISKGLVTIHPSLQNLIVSIRTAIVIDDWRLDKSQTSHDDVLDAFRLACLNYEIPRNNT